MRYDEWSNGMVLKFVLCIHIEMKYKILSYDHICKCAAVTAYIGTMENESKRLVLSTGSVLRFLSCYRNFAKNTTLIRTCF